MKKQRARVAFLLAFLIIGTFKILAIQPDDVSIKQYVKEIKNLFHKQLWESGKAKLDEASRLYDSNSQLLGLCGQYWYHRKDYEKARYQLGKALIEDRTNNAARLILLNIEEETHNYSSAICYINELLEEQPYSYPLWIRKIEMYRKQGNTEEAIRMLKRLRTIFPNNQAMNARASQVYEEQYQEEIKKDKRPLAISTIEDLLTINKKESYFADLIGLYLKEGNNDRAITTANLGLGYFPNSCLLLKRKIEVLTRLTRYSEAITLLKEKLPRNPKLRTLYNALIVEAAQFNQKNDPYTLYGMAYENKNKSEETLNYLLNTAITRGYTDDAIYYLHEARKRYGKTKELLYKEYQLYSRMGDQSRSYSILQTLYNSFPQDQEISNLMQECCIKRASQLMVQNDYTEALEHLRIILHRKGNDEITEKALEYSITCYLALSRYEEALSTLKILSGKYPDHPSLIEKQALILDKMDRTPEALDLLYNSIQNSPQKKASKYAVSYEEISIPYLKRLTENGATLAVLNEAQRLLQVSPQSNPGLHYCINASAALGRYDIMPQYINTGRTLYPADLFFRIKQALWLNQNTQYQAARELLHNDIDYYRNNKEIIGMFTQSSILYAQQLSGNLNRNKAIAILDTALLYNPGDKELIYNKGLIFEKMHQYDSAYFYQKFYVPSFAEQDQFSSHLRELQYSSSQNEARFSYMQSHYNDSYEIRSVATAEFSHKKQHDSYTFTANYTGRKGIGENYLMSQSNSDTISQGGTGIQLQAEWAHQLSKSYNLTLNAAWANRFFPTCSFNSTFSKSLQSDMEVGIHFGYKRLVSDENLWIAGPTISKNWEKIWASTKLEIYRMQSSFYYNASLQSRLYVGNNKHSNLSMITGIGSAPEISILNNALPGTFSHMNTMVGLGGQYLLSHNLTAGLTGSWYTYYNQTATNTSYKNLYNVLIQLSVAL